MIAWLKKLFRTKTMDEKIANGSTDSLEQVYKILVDRDLHGEFRDKVEAELIKRRHFDPSCYPKVPNQ